MFDHEKFDVYAYEKVPRDRDCYLIGEEYMLEWERAQLDFFAGGPDRSVGHVSFATVRNIKSASMDLDWYPNIFTRYHEVAVSLPKDQFVACVGCWQCDEKPHIFVRTAWLEMLHLRFYSIFCLVDADYFEDALRSGSISREKLLNLRTAVDGLAAAYPDVLFISFADSILLKSNWTVGHYRSGIKNTYRPEVFLQIFRRVQKVYKDILGLRTHCVLSQGSNEYYNDPLSHRSDSGNHMCLNTLGLPFTQLWAIGKAVKENVNEKRHPFAEMYVDEQLYHSLQLRFDFPNRRPEKYPYQCKMVGTGYYYCAQCQELLENLEPSLVEDNGGGM
jgi:hypothetical protein